MKAFERDIFLVVLFFVIFGSIFSINYLKSDDLFTAEIFYINNQKAPYSVLLNINNKINEELKLNIELVYEKQNLVVDSKQINCQNICEEKLEIKKIYFDDYKIIITTKKDGNLYKKELSFKLEKPKSNNYIEFPSKIYYNGKNNLNLSGIIFLEKPSIGVIQIVPSDQSIANQIDLKKDINCKSKICNFSISINKSIIFGKYSINVYLPDDSFGSNFELIYSENNQQIIEETNFTPDEKTEENIKTSKDADLLNDPEYLDYIKKRERNLLKIPDSKIPKEIELGKEYEITIGSFFESPLLLRSNINNFGNNNFKSISLPSKSKIKLKIKNLNDLDEISSMTGIPISDLKKRTKKPVEVENLEKKLKIEVDEVDLKNNNLARRLSLKKNNSRIIFENLDLNSINKIEEIKKDKVSDLRKDKIISEIINVDAPSITNAQVILKKSGIVKKILTCSNFAANSCLTSWQDSNLRFKQNSTNVWFNVSHFSAYVAEGGTYNFSVLFTDSSDRVIKQNLSDSIQTNITCISGTCGTLNISWYSTDIDVDTTTNTCQNYWGATCEDGPAEAVPNTFDACPSGIGADESVERMWLSQTSALPGDYLNITCELDPYTSADDYKIFYYNGTGWKRLFLLENTGSSTLVNISAVFKVDNNPGTHYVRCGIDYNQNDNVDGCADQGSWYDNDDIGFVVGNLTPIPTISTGKPFWTNSTQNQQVTLNAGEISLIEFYLNASGNVGDNINLIARVLQSTDESIISQSQNVKVSIADGQVPSGDKTNPLNGASTNSTWTIFNLTAQDNTELGSAEIYVWDSSNNLIHQVLSPISGSTNSTSWNLSFSKGDIYEWDVLITDSGGNQAWANGGRFTLNVTLPEIIISWEDPISDTFKQKFRAFDVKFKVECKFLDCGNLNASLYSTDFPMVNQLDDFESSFGTFWVTGNEGDPGYPGQCPFTRDSGGTPSGGTGPSIDHTLGTSAGFYLYTETSNGANQCFDSGDQAFLTSPYFVPYNGNLSFWWHMYGSNIGKLAVELNEDGTGWNEIWSRSGQFQTANADPYQNTFIDLTPYNGKNISLRFVMTAAGGFRGDTAIDDINLKYYSYRLTSPSSLPFNSLSSNPLFISDLKAGESRIISFTLNATGNLDDYSFFNLISNSYNYSFLNYNTSFIKMTIKPLTTISTCGTLNPNTLYQLTSDIIDFSGDCFIFGGDNIVFDGDGNLVDGVDGAGDYGFTNAGQPLRNNIVVENVRINDFDAGVYLRDVDQFTIRNSSITSSRSYGFRCLPSTNFGCYNVDFKNSTIDGVTRNMGFRIDTADNFSISDSTIKNIGNGGNSDNGIDITNSPQRITLNNVYLNNIDGDGIRFRTLIANSTFTNIIVNITNTAAGEGMTLLGGGYNLTIDGFTTYNTGDDGFESVGYLNNSILNNINLYDSTDAGFRFDSLKDSSLKNFIIDGTINNDGLISEVGTENSIIRFGSIKNIGGDTSDDALSFNSINNSFVRDIISNNISGRGLYLVTNSNYNFFDNFIINNTGSDGIRMLSSINYNNLTNFKITNIGNLALTDGIYMRLGSYLNKFENFLIENVSDDGIELYENNINISIYNFTIKNTTGIGIFANDNGNLVSKNFSLELIDLDLSNTDDGISIQAGDHIYLNNINLFNVGDGSGDDSIYIFNSTNLILQNIFVENSSDYLLRTLNGIRNASLNNITFKNSIGARSFLIDSPSSNCNVKNIKVFNSNGGEGMRTQCSNSLFENIIINNSLTNGFYVLNADSSSFKNFTIINSSTGDGVYVNNVVDSNFTGFLIDRFGDDGLELLTSINNDFSFFKLLQNATPTNWNLYLGTSSTGNSFEFNKFLTSTKVGSNSWSNPSFWNISTTTFPLGNFWNDLICSESWLVTYNSVEYQTCIFEDYILDSTNSRIDYGPLFENKDLSIGINFTNPTPTNGSSVNSNTTIINVSETGTLQRSSYIDWNYTLNGYWNFENATATTVYDYSSKGINGVISNGASINTSTNIRGKSIDFDGLDDYVNLSNSNLYRPTKEITIAVWVKINSFKPWHSIIGNLWDTGTTESGYYIGSRAGGNEVGFFMKVASFASDYWGSSYVTNLNTGQWYFLVGSYDGNNLKFYVNGNLSNSTPATGDIDYNPQPYALYLSRYYDDNEDTYFDGSIDEAMIFNRSLSDEEIKALYNSNRNQLYGNFTLGDGLTYKYYACNINLVGNRNCTETRQITSTSVTNISVVNPSIGEKIIENNSVYIEINSSNPIDHIEFYFNGDNSTKYIMTENTPTNWSYTFNTFNSGRYNISFWYNDTYGTNYTYNWSDFIYIKNISLLSSKIINSTSNSTYKINISLENRQFNQTIYVYDFIPLNFSFTNFSINPIENYSFSGTKYTGTYLKWKLNLTDSEKVNITYDLIGNNDYYLRYANMYSIE